MSDYGIKDGYQHRLQPRYTEDTADERAVWQPDVYAAAAVLAERYNARTIIDIGCGGAKKLALLAGRYDVIGIDYGSNLDYCRAAYPFGRWIAADIDGADGTALRDVLRALPPGVLGNAIVVCSDVIEHLVEPDGLLKALGEAAEVAHACLISTPERDLTHNPAHAGPPPNPCHVREWTAGELGSLLESFGLPVMHLGLTASHNIGWPKKTILAILDRSVRNTGTPAARPTTALLVTNNDADLVEAIVGRLHADGIRVHAIDLGSTDGTFELLSGIPEKLVGLERIGTPLVADDRKLGNFWRHVEDVARGCAGHWMVLLEANQIAAPTSFGPSLRAALAGVEASGFNTVGFTALDFHPMDAGYRKTLDAEAYFAIASFARSVSSQYLKRAWIQPDTHPVALADTSGCAPVFIGRRDFPYRFLLKNYPKRRFGRRDPHLPGGAVHDGVWVFPPAGEALMDCVRPDFLAIHLTECLFGVGLFRYDFGS